MTTLAKKYDLLAIGRSSIDLYANETGVDFTQIKNFGAFVGGCPTNIAVGTKRLGLNSALLTAVGGDPVGDFILEFLSKEGIDISFIPKKKAFRSSAVLLGIEPPDKFPLTFYRDNCADIQINIDDVLNAPLLESMLLLVSGTGLSKEPSRSATIFAMQMAKSNSIKVILDIDYRFDQWNTAIEFAVTINSILQYVDIVIGTQAEVIVSSLNSNTNMQADYNNLSNPQISGDINQAIKNILNNNIEALVLKKGEHGGEVHLKHGEIINSEPFKVQVLNVLGAGDAFASGFLYGYLKNWDWSKCLRMGNATGALIVTKQGCANFMAYEDEAIEFIETHGGF